MKRSPTTEAAPAGTLSGARRSRVGELREQVRQLEVDKARLEEQLVAREELMQNLFSYIAGQGKKG